MTHYVSEQVAVTPEFSSEKYDDTIKLSDLLNTLNDLWDKIPLEKQGDAYVSADLNHSTWSEETTAIILVHYSRHETEAEQKRRLFREREEAIRQEQKRAAALRAEEKKNQKNEERERAEYLRLKAKYEGG